LMAGAAIAVAPTPAIVRAMSADLVSVDRFFIRLLLCIRSISDLP